MPNLRKDAGLINTKALPAGASSVYCAGFDTGARSANGEHMANAELLISAPALAVGELADTETMTYKVQHDTDSAYGTPVTLADAVLVQTGAGGAGAAAATKRFRLPSNVSRYVRVAATNSAALSCAAASMTTELTF